MSEKSKQEVKSVNITQDCSKQHPVIENKSEHQSVKENSVVTERKECVVVVDNIKSPKKFRASTEIRKELSKFPEIKPKLSFSLPKGGVALEFENKEQAD